jgi:hypothetical protein
VTRRLPRPFPRRIEPIDLTDHAELVVWLDLISGHVRLLVEGVNDLLRPASKRKFSRTQAREQIAIARRNVKRLLRAAYLAIPPGTPLVLDGPDMDPPSER